MLSDTVIKLSSTVAILYMVLRYYDGWGVSRWPVIQESDWVERVIVILNCHVLSEIGKFSVAPFLFKHHKPLRFIQKRFSFLSVHSKLKSIETLKKKLTTNLCARNNNNKKIRFEKKRQKIKKKVWTKLT